jgi:hypothetical protein
MAELKEQNLKNHVRFDPPFHFFLAPVGLISVVVAIVHAVRQPSAMAYWLIVVAIAGLILIFKTRLYSLKTQDRVIRLEERLRIATLLPETLRTRAVDLKASQLVALRFASDQELPEIVERTVSGNLGPKEIKQSVRNWRADHHRV